MEKIKVVWVCAFSSEEMRNRMPAKFSCLERFLYSFVTKGNKEYDFAPWNINNIKIFETFDDVDLHIICPTRRIKKERNDFDLRGIHYHFFRDESTNLAHRLYRYFFTRYSSQFKRNRKLELKIIEEIKPDIIHLIGAENYYYSNVLLDVPENIPTLVQLQTLVSDPRRCVPHYPNPKLRKYALESEQRILRKANYIGATYLYHKEVILRDIAPNANILDLNLGSNNLIDFEYDQKDYDFVYFARDIKKAFELVIEAFALSHAQRPHITLDVIGFCDEEYKKEINARIQELGIQDSIKFEGLLPTIGDVMSQIKRSKFALLPIKGDMVSGTIYQAMSHGLPVVTCITPATPDLNKNRECVLLSAVGDHEAMAANMIKLIDNPDFANGLQHNAGLYIQERASRQDAMRKWVKAYRACIDNFYHHTPFDTEFLFK